MGLPRIALIVLFAMGGCAEKQPQNLVVPDPARAEGWQQVSLAFFMQETKPNQVLNFAEALNDMLLSDGQQSLHQQSFATTGNSEINTSWFEAYYAPLSENQRQTDAASYDLMLQRFKLYLLHKSLSFTVTELNVFEQQVYEQSNEIKEFMTRLIDLKNQYPVLHQGSFEIYSANQELGLFAYSRRADGRRAYIAYNVSFDSQQMPLPLGFMSSTKVSMWESSAQSMTTFIATNPIVIHPLSAVIIIVG